MTSLRRFSTVLLLAVAGLAVRPATSAADDKDVLQMIPADAWGYVYIPSIGGLNDGVTMMQNEIMGMAMMDAMQFLTAQMGIEKGLDNKGAAAVVMLDMKKTYGGAEAKKAPESGDKDKKKKDKEGDDDEDDDKSAGGSKEPPFILILPATNAKDLLSNFSPQKEEDGIAKCEIHGETSYAHVSGKYVLLSPQQGALKALLDSKESIASSLSPARKKLMNERSVIFSVAAGRVLDAHKDKIATNLGMMTAALPNGDMVGKQMDALLKIARQLAWADLAIGLDKNGLSFTGVATPQAGSELETQIREKKAPSGSLLKGLAGDQYVMALGAVASQGKDSEKDVQTALDTVLNNPMLKGKMDPDKFKAFVKKAQTLNGLMGSVGFTISSLADGPEGVVSASIVITTTNSERLMDGISSLLLMLKDLPASEADRTKFAKMVKHTAAAETVGSAKVDHLVIDPTKGDDTSEEEMAMVKKVLGSDGLLLRVAAADDKHVVLGFGGGKAQFTKIIDAAKSGDAALAQEPGIQKAADRLPGGRTFEMYISAESVMKVVNRVARAHGEDAPIAKVPSIDTPVSVSASSNDGAGRFDLVVPMQVIKGVRQAVTEASMGHRAKAKAGEGKGKKDSDEDDDEDDAKGKDKDKDKDKKSGG